MSTDPETETEQAVEENVSSWPTRTQVARRMNACLTTVRRLEGRTLFPKVVAGIARFRPSEVTAACRARLNQASAKRIEAAKRARAVANAKDGYEYIPTRGRHKRLFQTRGDEAARVFRCFHEQMPLNEIVMRFHVTPDRVRALYGEWTIDLQAGERLRQEQQQAEVERLRAELARSAAWLEQARRRNQTIDPSPPFSPAQTPARRSAPRRQKEAPRATIADSTEELAAATQALFLTIGRRDPG